MNNNNAAHSAALVLRAIKAKNALTNRHLAAEVEKTIDCALACRVRENFAAAVDFAEQALGMCGEHV